MPIETSPIPFANLQLPYTPLFDPTAVATSDFAPDGSAYGAPHGSTFSAQGRFMSHGGVPIHHGPASAAGSAMINPTPGGIAGPYSAIPALPDAGYTSPLIHSGTRSPANFGTGGGGGGNAPGGPGSIYAGGSRYGPPSPSSRIYHTPPSHLQPPHSPHALARSASQIGRAGDIGGVHVRDQTPTDSHDAHHQHHHHEHNRQQQQQQQRHRIHSRPPPVSASAQSVYFGLRSASASLPAPRKAATLVPPPQLQSDNLNRHDNAPEAPRPARFRPLSSTRPPAQRGDTAALSSKGEDEYEQDFDDGASDASYYARPRGRSASVSMSVSAADQRSQRSSSRGSNASDIIELNSANAMSTPGGLSRRRTTSSVRPDPSGRNHRSSSVSLPTSPVDQPAHDHAPALPSPLREIDDQMAAMHVSARLPGPPGHPGSRAVAVPRNRSRSQSKAEGGEGTISDGEAGEAGHQRPRRTASMRHSSKVYRHAHEEDEVSPYRPPALPVDTSPLLSPHWTPAPPAHQPTTQAVASEGRPRKSHGQRNRPEFDNPEYFDPQHHIHLHPTERLIRRRTVSEHSHASARSLHSRISAHQAMGIADQYPLPPSPGLSNPFLSPFPAGHDPSLGGGGGGVPPLSPGLALSDDGISLAGSALTFMDGPQEMGGRVSQYGLPKYAHNPKVDYRRFCVQRGKADVFLD